MPPFPSRHLAALITGASLVVLAGCGSSSGSDSGGSAPRARPPPPRYPS